MKINSHLWFLILLLVTLISSCVSMGAFDEEQIKTGESTTGDRLTENQPEITPKRLPSPPLEESRPDPNVILSNYHLGNGDKISITVFGEPDFSKETHLSESGTISYPFLGELKLSGLTVNEIERQITKGLQGDYLVNPKVTVTVLEYRQFFVNGEVKSPGGYGFVPGMTVNKAISLAGGFTDIASRDEIFVIREGNTTAGQSLATLKSYVGPGDIIIVKEYKKFFVNGAVNSRGSYDFIPDLTVEKAISMAGGFNEFASARRSNIYIIRDGDKTATKVPVNLNTPVNPGDIINVEESIF